MKAKPLPLLSRLNELFEYDPESGVVRKKKNGDTVGFPQGLGRHLCVCVDYKMYYLHRLIWKMVTKEDPPADKVVDHKDGNTHNNKWDNLRLVSKSVNNRNQHKKVFKYGYRGVSKIGNKYRAYVKLNGKYTHLGMYATVKEAVLAVKAMEQKMAIENNDSVMLERAVS